MIDQLNDDHVSHKGSYARPRNFGSTIVPVTLRFQLSDLAGSLCVMG